MKRIFILVGILVLSGCVSSFMEGWNEGYYGGISNSNMERFKETYGSRKSSSEGRCFPGGTNEGKYILENHLISFQDFYYQVHL